MKHASAAKAVEDATRAATKAADSLLLVEGVAKRAEPVVQEAATEVRSLQGELKAKQAGAATAEGLVAKAVQGKKDAVAAEAAATAGGDTAAIAKAGVDKDKAVADEKTARLGLAGAQQAVSDTQKALVKAEAALKKTKEEMSVTMAELVTKKAIASGKASALAAAKTSLASAKRAMEKASAEAKAVRREVKAQAASVTKAQDELKLKEGFALSLDGGAYLDPGVAASTRVARTAVKGLTVECWAKVRAVAGKPGSYAGLISASTTKAAGVRAMKGWMLGVDGSSFVFAVQAAGGDVNTTLITGPSPRLQLHRWYHVAATFDGKQMRLYINGKLQAWSSRQLGLLKYPETSALSVGRQPGALGEGLSGVVDDVAVWSRALTEGELLLHALERGKTRKTLRAAGLAMADAIAAGTVPAMNAAGADASGSGDASSANTTALSVGVNGTNTTVSVTQGLSAKGLLLLYTFGPGELPGSKVRDVSGNGYTGEIKAGSGSAKWVVEPAESIQLVTKDFVPRKRVISRSLGPAAMQVQCVSSAGPAECAPVMTAQRASNDANSTGSELQFLFRFADNMYGSGPTQVPSSGSILKATLRLNVDQPGGGWRLYRNLAPWNADTAFDSMPKFNKSRFVSFQPKESGYQDADITNAVRLWARDPKSNFGFRVLAETNETAAVFSPKVMVLAKRPQLVVEVADDRRPPIWFMDGLHTHEEARLKCVKEKAHLCSVQELLQSSTVTGFESCQCGWTSTTSNQSTAATKNNAGYDVAFPLLKKAPGCVGAPGINYCNAKASAGAYCCDGKPMACKVSDFGPWSDCSAKCGAGTQERTRYVMSQPVNGGDSCPPLAETAACSNGPCVA